MEFAREKYRTTFLKDGVSIEVLGDILQLCHFGCTLDPDNRVQVAEHNVGVVILNKMGVFSQGSLMKVIGALSQVTPDDINNNENE